MLNVLCHALFLAQGSLDSRKEYQALPAQSTSAKYVFRGRSGYILNDTLFSIGHTASVPPWADSHLHIHTSSEEYYLLLQGELRFLVKESGVTLKPGELLAVKPCVPHAIVAGEGVIEHFGFRAPAPCDKQMVGEIPKTILPDTESKRELTSDWGNRIPLASVENQNCWLLGKGTVRYESKYLSLANLNFSTTETANAGIGTRHRLHWHQQSWEYYIVLLGSQTLRIGDELINVEPGEILVVPPAVRHVLHSREAPYEGFTVRVPCLDWNDKVEL